MYLVISGDIISYLGTVHFSKEGISQTLMIIPWYAAQETDIVDYSKTTDRLRVFILIPTIVCLVLFLKSIPCKENAIES